MEILIPTGVFDILPYDKKEPWRSSYIWQHLEKAMREHAAFFCCQEIRTPMFERTELFQRSVGDGTDIVSKEMYTFQDKGGRSMSLRPEGTASVMRAFVEKQLNNEPGPYRYFYIGPMFRYERPQSGRYRQHHQFGVEIVGEEQPETDAETIQMLFALYEKLGLTNLTVHINTLGCDQARAKYRAALKLYLQPHIAKLSDDSKIRFEKNPLRILDSKDPEDKLIIEKAPSIRDFLTPECEKHFSRVIELLGDFGIPFQFNKNLVRGLDYYNRTVFEITSGQLGAQNTVGAGGRYDGLLKMLSGPDLPSIGFSTGIERIIQALVHQKQLEAIPKFAIQLYIIPLGSEATRYCLKLALHLRKESIACFVDTSEKKLKNMMQKASNSNAKYALVIGITRFLHHIF